MNFRLKWRFLCVRFFAILAIGGSVLACGEHKFNIDVSNIKLDNRVIRFDSLLFTDNPDSVAFNSVNIVNAYPQFSSLYFNKVIRVGGIQQSDFMDLLSLFLVDYDIQKAYEKSQELYGDFSPYKNKINDALRHFKYYFPSNHIPDIYTMISGFNQSVVVDDGVLAIALDKFLGAEVRFYEQLQISKFLRVRMTPEVMPYEVVRSWLSTEFVFNDSVSNLISYMVYHGKLLYVMDAIFPNVENHFKIGYSPKNMDWCEKSENEVWLYMMDKKVLFDTNPMLIRRFIEDAPFTSPFGKDSPGRVGQWIGWQIVKSYMEKNDDISIQELIKNNNYQQLLMQSGYNP